MLTIDQDVSRVIVTGGEGDPEVSAEDSEADPEATTVTLAVPLVHGEVLTAAEACGENFSGRLALALRSFGDASEVPTRSVWAQDGAPPTCAGLLGLDSLQ